MGCSDPSQRFSYTHSQPANTSPSPNRGGNLGGAFLPLELPYRTSPYNNDPTFYWLLKISKDTFYEVDESANNKEIPMAGRKAAKNKSVNIAHRVVNLKTAPQPVLSGGFCVPCPQAEVSKVFLPPKPSMSLLFLVA